MSGNVPIPWLLPGSSGASHIRELPQVRITRDDALRARHPRERHKVVIPGVRRQARIGRRIVNQQPVLHQAGGSLKALTSASM
jgi:hypothetical protein